MKFFSFLSLILIKIYQKIISPHLQNCCRFVPSCSEYGYEAFKKNNFIKAFKLIFIRICKCNPFGGNGYDPVK